MQIENTADDNPQKDQPSIESGQRIEFEGQEYQISRHWQQMQKGQLRPGRKHQRSKEVIDRENAYWDKVFGRKKSKHTPNRARNPLLSKEKAKRVCWEVIKEEMAKKGEIYKFAKNSNLKTVLAKLVDYFTWQENSELELDKGIWLYGNTGVGKTFLMEVFQILSKKLKLPTVFEIRTMRRIARKVATDGVETLNPYAQGSWCIDDIGHESVVFHYKNRINCFEEILTEAYDRYEKSGKRKMLLVTSNFGSANELREMYGDRIVSRCQKMFNFVCLVGPAYRNEGGSMPEENPLKGLLPE